MKDLIEALQIFLKYGNPDRPAGFKNLGQLEVLGSCYTAEEVTE